METTIREYSLYSILESILGSLIYGNYPRKQRGSVRDGVSMAGPRDKVLLDSSTGGGLSKLWSLFWVPIIIRGLI